MPITRAKLEIDETAEIPKFQCQNFVVRLLTLFMTGSKLRAYDTKRRGRRRAMPISRAKLEMN